MVYDVGVIRSIVALALALLILGAAISEWFLESPVCAVVDGASYAVPRKPAEKATPSCCGSPTCPMKAGGCAKGSSCPMDPAGAGSVKESSSATKLCAPSCGSQGARLVPGAPDPGTLDPAQASIREWGPTRALALAPDNLATRNPVPTDPPPRA